MRLLSRQIGSIRRAAWRVLRLHLFCLFSVIAASAALSAEAPDATPPQQPVKLVFIHHSCGENWLNDGNGDLARALQSNNYFVSDTNYGWGPDGIGDRTDIPDWPDWFVGLDSQRILASVYAESDIHSSYRRTLPDPGGENTIMMFKSCFPNSGLEGNPDDPPSPEWSLTVGHAKYVYNRLLDYFRTRPDRLFVVITAPPLLDPTYANNARSFDRWLVNDWLEENDYPFANVAAWNFHAVLSHPDNHHRLDGGHVEHIDTNGRGTLRYDSDGDEHPSQTGNRKATAEFVPMLNLFYNRWQAQQSGEKDEQGPAQTAEEETDASSTSPADMAPLDETGSGDIGPGPDDMFQASHPRLFPDTEDGIFVFNDQLGGMTEAQRRFAVSHYAGTQKVTRHDADLLRALDTDFLVLHYRLGLGLGYRTTGENCNPGGEELQIIDSDWVREWPGDDVVRPNWFFSWQGQPVFMCEWGWFLMDVDDDGWRDWWSQRVLDEMAANDADGLFADSMSVPNMFGGQSWKPPLPDVDADFEAAWSQRIENFISYIGARFAGRYYLIPNVGNWVNGRDMTDYSGADGVMVEGFGYDAFRTFGEADWVLQLERVLGLTARDKVILAQSYETDSAEARLFTLASYLLVKGSHSFINIDYGLEPEWWPEYALPVGYPLDPLPTSLSQLQQDGGTAYLRRYSNAMVLVNPASRPAQIELPGSYYLACPSGGGNVPEDGWLPDDWTIDYTAVDRVTLPPGTAAILIRDPQQTAASKQASLTSSPLQDHSSPPPEEVGPLSLEANSSEPPDVATEQPATSEIAFDRNVQAGDFTYLGAFRLPLDVNEENSFAYGGEAMTFRPDGDPAGANDGFSGSLFLTGHPYQLPKGRQVAEITIPRPVIADTSDALPMAEILQPLSNVTGTVFEEDNELPRIGLQYLTDPTGRPLVHIAFGQHLASDETSATHGAFNPSLSAPDFRGPWHLAGHSFYTVNGYLFEIPKDWADRYVDGRVLATGRFRDGGWSGMGPSLIAYRPWDEQGNLAPSGSDLSSLALIKYLSSGDGDDPNRIMEGYQPPDEWEGGAWLTTSTGRSAVLFAGTKAVGEWSWYGFRNLEEPQSPCVNGESASEDWSCRTADGRACALQYYRECENPDYVRGWWSDRFEAQFILYDPQDLVEVAAGRMDADQPQPYVRIPIDDHLFLNVEDNPELGSGAQRRYRIGAVAYNRGDDLLYVIEQRADGPKPVVHVWQVR